MNLKFKRVLHLVPGHVHITALRNTKQLLFFFFDRFLWSGKWEGEMEGGWGQGSGPDVGDVS